MSKTTNDAHESKPTNVDKAVLNMLEDSEDEDAVQELEENLNNKDKEKEEKKNENKDEEKTKQGNKNNDKKKQNDKENVSGINVSNANMNNKKDQSKAVEQENSDLNKNTGNASEQNKDNNKIKDNLNSSETDKLTKSDEIDYDKEIFNILKKYTDIYAIEYLFKEMKLNSSVAVTDKTLEKLYEYITAYKAHANVIDTGFDAFMLNMIKNFKVEGNSVEILQCVSLLDEKYEWINYYRHIVGYSKTYNNLKEVLNASFENGSFFKNDYHYLYVSYLITLLDNDELVYKNLKPLLKTLIRYIKNDIVEKNIDVCAKITSAIAHGAPTLFTDKFVASLLAYYTKVIFDSRNYINFNLDGVVECINVLLMQYKNIDNAFIAGSFREGIGKLIEFKNSTIDEEIKLLINTANILSKFFVLYIKNNELTDEIKEYKKYLDPKFITCDNPKQTDAFLIHKYTYLDLLLEHFNCYNRIDLLNDLTKASDSGLVFDTFKKYSEYVDWNDFVDLNISHRFIKYLFEDYFITERGENHVGMIKLFLNQVKEDHLIYFAKYAAMKNCYFVIVELYMQNVNVNTFDEIKKRQLLLKSANEISKGEEISKILEEFEKIDKKDYDELKDDGYKNTLLFLIVLVSKMKNKKYSDDDYTELSGTNASNIKKYKQILQKMLKPDNIYNDLYLATSFYLDKDINREFYCYYDVVLELLSIQVRGLREKEIQRFKDTTYPLLFQMTQTEIQEIGILYKEHKDSKYFQKYKDILELMGIEEDIKVEENEEKKSTEEVFDYESMSESSELSSSFMEEAMDQEQIFLRKQRDIIFEKYDLAQREKQLEEEKFLLAKKEHDLLRETSEKFSKAQKKLIKEKFKEAKKAYEEMQKQYERIKREKEEIEKNFRDHKNIRTHNILDDNYKKAKAEHDSAKQDYLEAKQKYKEGNQRFKDALKDLDLLKEQINNESVVHTLVEKKNTRTQTKTKDKKTDKIKTEEEKILEEAAQTEKLTKEQKEMLENKDSLKKEGFVPRTKEEQQLEEFRKATKKAKGKENTEKQQLEEISEETAKTQEESKEKNEKAEDDIKADYSVIFDKP